MINRGTKWLIYVIGVLTMMVDFGLVLSFGTLFLSMMDTFQTDRATTVTVHALYIGVTMGFGIVSGILISRLGLPVVILVASVLIPLGLLASFFTSNIKILYFNIGIVSAFGTSIIYISTLVLTGRLFSGRQQILCVTLLLTSNGVASVIYPYLLVYLLEMYGLYGTFLILSGLTSNTFVLSVLCWTNRRHLRGDNKQTMEKESSASYNFNNVKTLMKTSFVCVLIAFGISVSSFDVYMGVILDIDVWKRLGDHKALTLIVFHTSSIVSRLIPGLLKQRKGINIFICPTASAICGCIALLIVFFSSSHAVYLIGSSLCGMAIGGIIASVLSAVVKIVETEQVPVASGLMTTLAGILTVATGPLFGYIRDTTGSYGNVILTIVSIQAVSVVLYILALLSRRHEKTSVLQNQDSLLSTGDFKQHIQNV